LLLFASQPTVDVTDANQDDDGPWASFSFDGRLRRVRRPTSVLHMRDVDTGEAVDIAPELVDDLPPTDETIIYKATFDASGRLIGRLLPERTANNGPDVARRAAFAPRSDATALYLARYMPWSRAALTFMNTPEALSVLMEGLYHAAGLMLFDGFIDIQGMQQLMADSLVDDKCAPDDLIRDIQAKYGHQPYEWWHELVQNADTIQAACFQHNRYQVSAESANAASTLDVLRDFSALEEHNTLWTQAAARLHAVIVEFFINNGRVGTATSDFVEAAHTYDMLFWHDATGDAAHVLRQSPLAGWIEPSTTLTALGASARAAMSRLHECTPIVVVNHTEQWNDYALSYLLATLVWAAPPPSNAGVFAATGSHVPVKIVMLCDSMERVQRHAKLGPQSV